MEVETVPCPSLARFGYLFPDLQRDPANLLAEDPITVQNLMALGRTMAGSQPVEVDFDSTIPSVYTYFSQFVDHDISLEEATKDVVLDGKLIPWPLSKIEKIENSRSATLDLDSVYGPTRINNMCYPVPRQGNKMVIEQAIKGPPDTDLPREPKPYRARIGDPRNDENLIISQLHLAFLRAHNSILDLNPSLDFEQARTLLRQHYQFVLIKDFLPRIADPKIVNDVLDSIINIYDPPDDDSYMPLEFSVAAYRFGHSMIRSSYNYNAIFEDPRKSQIDRLLMPQALGGYHHILPEWIILWDRFVGGGSNPNLALRIDTHLARPLSNFPDAAGNPIGLAVRDLLRGYLLRLPTGQAVAQALGARVMTPQEIEDAVSNEEKQVLRDPKTNLSGRTPLWYYVLVEAVTSGTGRLGPVGSTLVAAVLVGQVRRSKDSFLMHKNWSPTLGQTKGQFTLPDLLRLAKVLA